MSGKLPSSIATEAVMLQYAVDCRLDELLSTVYSTATKPPLTRSPFSCILPVVRAHACKMHLWKEDSLSLQNKRMNQLSRIGPSDCFMYSGVLHRDSASVHARCAFHYKPVTDGTFYEVKF